MDPSRSTSAAPAPPLGRYELVHLLGQGGMGEVYLAKISGAAGFEKPCIVKTVLPALLKDSQFLARFHHEAKVLVHLSHSSIAQVYDMGEAGGTYYMALEYVAGVDLAYLLEQSRSQGRAIPVPVALYLGQRMAEGLGYAHRKLGPDGAPLGIVHRDVSPHNVMVSYEGEVKVIDFGLAKSAARSRYTMPSTVMGKLGYMSPEQVRAEPVDHRTDLYSCAVVVWELLSGRSLFAPGTVGEMMAAMSQPTVPSLCELRPDVTPELDAVLRRALSPQAEARHARADDFARALNEHSLRASSSVGSEEVGIFVRELCPQAFASQRALLGRLASSPGARRPSQTEQGVVVPLHTGIQHPAAHDSQSFGDTLMRSPNASALPVVAPRTPSEERRLAPSGPSRKGWVVAISLAAGGLVAASAGITAVMMSRQRPPPPFAPSPRWEPGMGRLGLPPPLPPLSSLPIAAPALPVMPTTPVGDATPTAPPLIPATRVAALQRSGKNLVVAEGRGAGLQTGMVLRIVETPTVEGLARQLGTATVIRVAPRHAVLRLDTPLSGDPTAPHFVVLPPPRALSRAATPSEGRAAAESPSAPAAPGVTTSEPVVTAPAAPEPVVTAPTAPEPVVTAPTAPEPVVTAPAAPEPTPVRQLGGRIRLEKIGPFATKVILTSTDTVFWSKCVLVIRGRDVYKLGIVAPGEMREVSLKEFRHGGPELPFVTRGRMGLFCAEGQKEFPADV